MFGTHLREAKRILMPSWDERNQYRGAQLGMLQNIGTAIPVSYTLTGTNTSTSYTANQLVQ